MLKRTQYQDPQSHNGVLGGRTVIQVPKTELRNFRLIGAGIDSYSSGSDRQYAYNCGVLSLIDQIVVYDGTQEVAKCRGTAWLGARRILGDSGAQNYSVGSDLYGTSLRYNPDVLISADVTSPALGQATSNLCVIDLGRLLPFFYGLDVDAYGQMSKAVKGGKRKRVRELINKANVIQARELDLRIEITYTSMTASQLFVNGVDGDVFTIARPILVCDEIVGAQRQKDFQIVYDTYDIENVTIPAAAATVTVATPNFRLQGADGTFLKEVTLINGQYAGGTLNANFKGFGSTAMNAERINLVVNSKVLLPIDCDSPARKLMYYNYNNPNATCPILSNLYDHGGFAGLYEGEALVNLKHMSYLTLDIESRISNLYLQYSRMGYDAGAQVEEINLIALYTIQNVLTHKGGRTIVSR